MKKLICSFIRFTDQGSVEKVSWYKQKDGTKSVEKAPFKPGAIELRLMADSMYGEIII